MDDKLRSVLDKITKLRALAAGAATQAEAEAAAAQAEALIAKYQIDEAQIETTDTARTEAIGEEDPLWAGERNDAWRSDLGFGIVKIHGCAMLVNTRRTRDPITCERIRRVTYRVAGRPSDVAIVRYLFAWLTVEISRLAAREEGRAAKNAFRRGAVYGVLAAMRKAQATETRTATPTSAAMVLVGRAAQSEAWIRAATDGKIGTVRTSPTVGDADAFRRGHAAGGSLTGRAALPVGGRLMLGAGR